LIQFGADQWEDEAKISASPQSSLARKEK